MDDILVWHYEIYSYISWSKESMLDVIKSVEINDMESEMARIIMKVWWTCCYGMLYFYNVSSNLKQKILITLSKPAASY